MEGITKRMNNVKVIYIFDLDGTIDKDEIKGGNVDKLRHDIINKVTNYDSDFYILTARRIDDFKDENDCMCYNISPKLTNLFYDINQNKRHRWFYYNDNIDITLNRVQTFLKKNRLLEDALKYEKVKGINTNKAANFFMGIQKMLYIEEIMGNYKYQPIKIVFFDDASYNKRAYEFYKRYNPYFEIVQFHGGKDKSVFPIKRN